MRYYLGFLICALALIPSNAASAAPVEYLANMIASATDFTPKFEFRLVDREGSIFRLSELKYQVRLIRQPKPVLRVSIILPDFLEPDRSSKVITETPEGVQIDVVTNEFSIDVLNKKTFANPLKGENLTLFGSVISKGWGPLVVDPSCSANRVFFSQEATGGDFLFALASCRDNVGAVNERTGVSISIAVSDGSAVKSPTLPITSDGSGVSVVSVVLPEKAGKLGMIQIAGSRFGIYHVPVRRPKVETARFSGTIGGGFTYLSYSENPHAISVGQVGFTGKGGATYALVPERWTLGASAFITLASITTSTMMNQSAASLTAARYLGINGRIGYTLPLYTDTRWTMSPGYYIWSMIVPGNTYGVRYLGGPQIFISMTKPAGNNGRFLTYFKFAPISEQFQLFSTTNREIAIGGGYPLTPSLSLTLDLSDARFTETSGARDLVLQTVSLGLAMGL